MERQYFKVSFQYSENVYCANIAIAESIDDVNREYSKYTWYAVKPATEYDVQEAREKNMPFIAIEHAEPAADPESTEQAEQETTEQETTEQEENNTMMNFDMIKAEIIEDAEQQRRKTEFYINNGYLNNWPEQNRVFSDNGLERYSTGTRWSQYKNGTISRAEAVNYAIARYNRQSSKETAKKLAQLDRIQNAPDLTWCSVSVEFRRSSVWGYNPHVESRSNGGYTTGTASGCGYDKESAAIATAWNQNDSLLKVLCTMKEKALRAGISDSSATACTGRNNTPVIGYGAGYSAIPYFEGGVGTSEFLHIMEKAGFTVSSYYGKHENSYSFERQEDPENV